MERVTVMRNTAVVLALAVMGMHALQGCTPPAEDAQPGMPPVVAVGDLNNLYVLAPARVKDDEPGFRYAQRDAAGAWPESLKGQGYGTPAAVAAWRETLLVFFPSGRWGRFGPAEPVIEASPAPAWKPVAVCEDGLAADAFGWNDAGEPIYVRLGEGEPTWQRMDVALDAAKVLDPCAVRHLGRLYLVWREPLPALPDADVEYRVRFAYREGGTWRPALSRLRVASAPLVAAAGEEMVCLYRRPEAGGPGSWTLATYAKADEDWHEVGPLAGTIPEGALAVARQRERLYVVAAAEEGLRIAPLQVAGCRVGEFAPVPLLPAARGGGEERLYAILLLGAVFGAAVLLLARRPRSEPKAETGAPAAGLAPASMPRRAVAVAVDHFLLAVVLAPLILSVAPDLPERLLRGEAVPPAEFAFVQLAHLVLMVVYFTLAEGATGRTVGKALAGIQVRGLGGERVTWKQSLVRNLLRVVDEMPVAYLVGLAFVVIGPRPQRLGDRAARTLVVRAGASDSSRV